MADSIYGGLARGLQTGLQLGSGLAQQRVDNERQARRDTFEEEERTLRLDLLRRAEERADNAEVVQRMRYGLEGVDKEIDGIQGMIGAAYANGQEPDPALGIQLAKLDDQRKMIYAHLSGNEYQSEAARYQDLGGKLNSGELDLDSVSPDDLYGMIAYATGRPAEEFLGDGPVGRALQATEAALQGKDLRAAIHAGGTFLAPEMDIGVGDFTKDGSRVARKRVSDGYRMPGDPDNVTLGLDVEVQRPDGVPGRYHAPYSEGRRTGDDNDPPKRVPIKKLFERLQLNRGMHDLANTDVVRAKLEEAVAGGAAERFRNMRYWYARTGGDPTKLMRKLDADKIDLGDRVLVVQRDKDGKAVKTEEYKKGAAPRAPRAGGSGSGSTFAEIAEWEASGEITPEEAEEHRAALRNKRTGLKDPKADKPQLTFSEALNQVRQMKEPGQALGDPEVPKYKDEESLVAAAHKLMALASAPAEQAPPPPTGGLDPLQAMERGGLPAAQRQGAPAVQAPLKAPPSDPKGRIAGQVYETPRGPMQWTGSGWLPQ